MTRQYENIYPSGLCSMIAISLQRPLKLDKRYTHQIHTDFDKEVITQIKQINLKLDVKLEA